MKKMKRVLVLGLMLLTTGLFAQNSNVPVKASHMVIWLSDTKTTNLVFPYGIKDVNKGSEDILLQKVNGVENILQARAAKRAFAETNLTVITVDGQMYSPVIKYALQPPLMNVRFEPDNAEQPIVQFSKETDNQGLFKKTAELVAAKYPVISNAKDSKYSITFKMTGVYIEKDVFYFQVRLENNSNVNYSVDQLRLFIRDQKQAKRTASQEVELQPIQTFGNLKVVGSKSAQTAVIAIPKFTIPDQKEMIMQLQEAGGGRHLKVYVKNRQLLGAKFL